MAKTFYRLQRFLRQAQVLLLFLSVAYIMAGSLLLLQRSHMALFQKGTRKSSSLHTTPPRSLVAPKVSWRYINPEPIINQHTDINPDSSGSNVDLQRFTARNLQIRHLRHHWIHAQTQRPDQDTTAELKSLNRESKQKGTHIGCFKNDEKQPALGGTLLYDFRKMTSTLCQNICAESAYRFAGLEYGTECHCGNRISAARARSQDCNLVCRTERGSPCGGVARLSIYKTDHMTYRNVQYHGCFRIQNASAVFQLQSSDFNMTSQRCVEICTNQELPLAVLRGRDCLCGHTSFLLLQKNVDGPRCGRSKLSYSTSHEDYMQVYSTPLLASRCKEKMFRPESSSSLTALTSFPGAGNTWLRHLIELATGYYTGSYYFDGSLYNKGFKGEKDYWKSGRTICVKTHESGKKEIEKFDSAILLMRNPYHCLVAEFNRKNAGHLGYATDTHWRSKEWPEFVESYSSWWVSHALAWLQFSRRLLVVHYEQLHKDLINQLRVITTFLNVSTTDDRLLCTESNRDGNFKRPGSRRLTFDPFTSEMRTRIGGYIRVVNEALRDRNLSGLPGEYMSR